VQHPIRAVTIFIGLTLATLPTLAHAQEGGAVSEAALTMPVLQTDNADEHAAAVAVKPEPEKKPKQATHRAAKTARPKAEVSQAMVPRSTFEDRTARYFDPLSLTLAPETRFDTANSEYSQVTNSFVPADKAQIAIAPDAPVTNEITSASIENMGKGNNHTIVVPLFQLLNQLSPGPAPQ
jgi:hypothetical protein